MTLDCYDGHASGCAATDLFGDRALAIPRGSAQSAIAGQLCNHTCRTSRSSLSFSGLKTQKERESSTFKVANLFWHIRAMNAGNHMQSCSRILNV